MVKRTAVVLGILSVMLMAGTSNAFIIGQHVGDYAWEWEFMRVPTFCPVPCPPDPCDEMIVKTWSLKVEGPCPPPCGPGVGCGPWGKRYAFGWVGRMCGAIATPFDWLFGGIDGVYGCTSGAYETTNCTLCCGGLPGLAAAIVRGPFALW